MKKIGFVDYYLSEWHANNYPNWIAQMNEKAGTDYQVAYGWAERDISPVDGVSTAEWCAKNKVTPCETIEELCEKSDVILILAPSNPEKHLGYAKRVLPFGKRTYIDKTFAPCREEAEAIYRAADEGGAVIFSSSALRYAAELEELGAIRSLFLTGGGSNFNEYIIHDIEMLVKVLKSPAVRVCVEAMGKSRLCRVQTENAAEAVIYYNPAAGYELIAEKEDGECIRRNIASDFFPCLIGDILHFFETGDLSFDRSETLEVMKVRDALLKAEAAPGSWIDC